MAVKSVAAPGMASVRIEVKSGTDIPQALDEIESAVARIQTFPAGAARPEIREMTNSQSIIRLIVYGDISERSLKELAYRIEDDLTSLPTVSLVESLLILPNHLSHLHGPEWTPQSAVDRFFAGTQGYVDRGLSRFIQGPLDRGLRFATDQPLATIAGAIGILILSISLLRAGYSRKLLEARLDELYGYCRTSLQEWREGDVLPAAAACQKVMGLQVSRLFVGVDASDCIGDVLKYEHLSLITHVQKALPKFMMNTPAMRKRRRIIFDLIGSVYGVHTPAQRKNKPRDLVDSVLDLHASDPQFFPETDMGFMFIATRTRALFSGIPRRTTSRSYSPIRAGSTSTGMHRRGRNTRRPAPTCRSVSAPTAAWDRGWWNCRWRSTCC